MRLGKSNLVVANKKRPRDRAFFIAFENAHGAADGVKTILHLPLLLLWVSIRALGKHTEKYGRKVSGLRVTMVAGLRLGSSP